MEKSKPICEKLTKGKVNKAVVLPFPSFKHRKRYRVKLMSRKASHGTK